jgi:hypothetical protein
MSGPRNFDTDRMSAQRRCDAADHGVEGLRRQHREVVVLDDEDVRVVGQHRPQAAARSRARLAPVGF